MDLLASILGWIERVPDQPAHISGDRSLTYGGLGKQSDSLAAYLQDALRGDGTPVAFHGHKEPEMLVGFLAAIKAGHPYVPLDISLPAERIQRIIARAGVRLLLTPPEIASIVSNPPNHPHSPVPRSKDELCYIIFTSGSTGEPKGVQITLGCLESFLDWMLAEQVFTGGGEVFLNQAPFSFDLSVMDLYCSLATGGTLWSITREEIESPKRLFANLARSGITTWVSTPSFAKFCLGEPTFNAQMLPQLRRLLFCGETLPKEVAGGLLEKFPDASVWNTYGPTEATVATTSIRVEHELLQRYPALPIGRPKPDTRILLLDEDGHEVAPGSQGEINIVGPNVGLGYLNSPEQTERVFGRIGEQRSYCTGDMGFIQDGLLFFGGRRDDQVKLHGYRIELGEIEAQLRVLPGVKDAVVLAAERQGVQDYLLAFLIADDHQHPPIGSQLRAALAHVLPQYMLPRKYIILDQYPINANGKIDRRRLLAPLSPSLGVKP